MKYTSKVDLDREVENAHTSKVQTIPFKNDKKRKKKQEKKSISKCCKYTMIIGGIIIGIIVIGVVAYFVMNKKKDENKCKSWDILCENNSDSENNGNGNNENNQKPQEENEPKSEEEPISENKPKDENDDSLISEELKEVFKPVFDINSKVGTLTQTLMESKQNLKIKSIDSTEYTFFKAIFDTYIISENSPEKSQISKLYNKKITTSIAINSFCYTSEGKDCELIKYLDLSSSNKNNLRNAEESNPEELTIPICLIEHTESNIILSINCPNNLEENFKSLLKLAFENIKPETIKGAEDVKTLADINVETKENKIYINSFSKLCEDEEKDDKTCESQKKIITDTEGNFISSNQKLTTETYLNIFENDYNFKDITLESSGNLKTVNYKSNLPKIIESFKTLSNAENNLATSLFDDMSKLLIELENKMISEFTKINNLLAFKDLSSIFNISELIDFPDAIVSIAKDLFINIKTLRDDLSNPINEYKIKLKDDISSFLSNEHDLMSKLFNNLKDLNTLMSKKNRIANIASFYEANDTNTFFMNIIKSANDILNNYYIYEKDKIGPILNKFFGEFLNKSLQLIDNGQLILDNITNRLEDNSATINNKNKDDINSVIENLHNVKILEKEIITSISEIMKKDIFENNGYLVNDELIEKNKESNAPIYESTLNLVNSLSSNKYIDEKFDEIMKYYREQFIVILKYIETSKRENFPIKSNVLSISFEDLDNLFTSEKINIKNLLENNNKDFLNSINQKINSFSVENQDILLNLIKKIENNLSKINLYNIDHKFYEMLNYSMNNISIVLDNNFNLALIYLNDIKNTTNLTQKIKNSMTTYLSQLNKTESYITLEFTSDLVNKYKNVTNQFKEGLQSIKSNSIIKKYYEYKDLSFFKKHIDIYINQSFSIIDEFISDEIFNSKYLYIINDFIKSSLNKINTQRKKINELYSPIS